MDRAIVQIKQLIQYHENQLEQYIEFFTSKKFKDNTIDYLENSEFTIENTKKIYGELIDELNKAIEVLENYQSRLQE